MRSVEKAPAFAGRPGDEEVTAALSSLPGWGDGSLELLERRACPYRSSYALEELRVRRESGVEERLVLKDLGRSLARPEVEVKPSFLHDPLREIETYNRVLGPHGLSAPACAGTVVEPEADRYWLFLEWIEGDLLWQVGEPDAWLRAARWLARMHSRFAGRGRPARRLIDYDGAYYRRWPRRVRRFAERAGTAPARLADLEWLAERVGAASRWLESQAVTLLHGEFYPSNVLVEETGGSVRIRPVDWEMAGWGCGILDLAALASGSWDGGEREAIVAAYRRGLPPATRPSTSELDAALARCRLLLAVQWSGWSSRWTPPPEHAQDWLGAAFELAEKTSTPRSHLHP